MKKILLLTVALLLFSVSCFAKVTEWVDPAFNFNTVKRVYVWLTVPAYFRDGSKDMEMEQAFFPQIREHLKNKLPRGYEIDSVFRVIERIKTEQNIDLKAMYQKSPKQAYDCFIRFVLNNYDLGMYVTTIAYDQGYEYVEGIPWNEPVTYTSTITDVYNPMNQWNVTTEGTRRTKIGNGIYPAIYVTARMDIFNMKNGRTVWSRVDRRERLIKPLNKSTNKSMFARMSGDFADMMLKKLTTAEGKPTGKIVSSNPAGF
jgi:hypothetical protein